MYSYFSFNFHLNIREANHEFQIHFGGHVVLYNRSPKYLEVEYSAPVWLNSAHTDKIDTKLNSAMRGTLKSTPQNSC